MSRQRKEKAPALANLIKGLIVALSIMGGVIVVQQITAPPAHAESGGYPYSGMACVWSPYATTGTGNWCKKTDPNGNIISDYDWGTIHDNNTNASELSPYGYDYRNCTDYVAWKVSTWGVSSAQYRGLGNAKSWASPPAGNNLAVDTTPAVGAAAVDTSGTYGHVAFIQNYDPTSGVMTVSEYNHGQDGNYGTRTGTASQLGFSQFVHFEKYETNSAGTGNSTLRTIPTSDGHIQLFKISNNTLSENWYSYSSGTFGNWTQPVAMPSTPTGTPTLAIRSGQNVIDAFVRGSNNNIYETWYNFQYGTWGGWINLGGDITADPQAIATPDGHEQIFGTGNNALQQNWFAPDGSHGNWASPVGLGAGAVGSPALAARPAGQNTIDAFVRGGNNQIYETWYNWGNGAWGGWIGMGGTITSDPQALTTSDGHDQVFGTGNNIVRENWFATNGTFGGWTTSPGLSSNALGSPAIAIRSGQNVIDAFVRDSNGLFYETWYSFQFGNWGGWINMVGGYTTSDPQTQPTPDGHDQVFGGSSNQAQQDWFSPDGTYGNWISF